MPVLRGVMEGSQSGAQQPASAGAQPGNRVVRLRGNERLSQIQFEKQVWPSAGKVNHGVNGRPSPADARGCANEVSVKLLSAAVWPVAAETRSSNE
jgi:hypothetical protein